jgi:hypothetical protein
MNHSYGLIQILQRPTPENKQKLVALSKNVAAAMTEIIQAAEAIKGTTFLYLHIIKIYVMVIQSYK